MAPREARSATAAPPVLSEGLRQFLFAIAVLAVLCLFCAPLFVDTHARDAPPVRRGEVSFAGFADWGRAASLTGDWRLVWRGPDTRGGPHPGDVALVKVPGLWADGRTLAGAPLPRSGYAAYEITLKGLPAGAYTLFVPTITHASRVWVDGRLVSAMGRVGATPAATRYVWGAHSAPIHAEGRDVQVVIEIAAFHHYSDGLEGAPEIGAVTVMNARSTLELSQELLFIVTLLILFFYGAVVFSFRTDDVASLFFGLSCLCLIPTAMVIGHQDLLQLLYPQLDFRTQLSIEYLTCIGAFAFLLAYTDGLFPRERLRWLYWTLQALFGLSVVILGAILAGGDTLLASELDRYALYVAAVEMAYIIVVVFIAALRRREGAAVFLLGMTLFAVSVIQAILVQYDILPSDRVIGYDLAPMGLVVFSFCHLIILAQRWSAAIRTTGDAVADMGRLMEVSSTIASEIHLDALLRRVVEAASRFLQADRTTLFLHDPRTDELWSMVAEGLETREIRISAHSGIAGASFASGEPDIVNDAYADPRFNRAVDEATGYRTRAILTLPIITRDGRRLGVMQALNRRDGKPFGAADVDRMRAFAAHAAVAIENATLFSDVLAARNYNDSILASMAGGVITLDPDARVVTVNAAAAAILEINAALVLGLPAPMLLTAQGNGWLADELEAVRTDGKARAFLDVEARTGTNRTISVNLSIVPLINAGVDAGLLVIFEDISQEKRLQGAMRRFMTQAVVDQVLGRQDDLMFGVACEASVLFADIRGFTSLAEHLRPRETVDMLNEVFAELVEAVTGHDGVLDKFIGDAVMAVFGAPIASGRDALNAVESANAMMAMLALLNTRRTGRGDPPLRLGVGVATGELIAGTIGSPKRMDYTVIGDSVNLASRLQDLTKAYGVGVLVCEATAMAVRDTQRLRRLDTVSVRGRGRPERVYQLLTYLTEEEFPHAEAVVALYERGLTALESGEAPAAVDAFEAALALNPDDTPSRLMLERARAVIGQVTA